MAITLDTGNISATHDEGASSLSWTHTNAASVDGLFVGGGCTANPPKTYSSVTYNAVSMTQIWSAAGTYSASAGFHLVAPATGANTVAVTLSGSNSGFVGGCGIGLIGVNQTTPFGTAVTATGSSTNPSLTVTDFSSATDPDVILDVVISTDLQSFSVGANQTERVDRQGTTEGSVVASSQSEADGGVMSWTADTAAPTNWHGGGVAFEPAEAAGDPELGLIGGKLVRGGMLLRGIVR